jgi:soluble lytic murein transglycosylase-like protein
MRHTNYRAEIEAISVAHGLDPDLVEALVLVESNGKTHAYRYEKDFYARYMQGKPEWDGTIPERVSASYGLCQVMFATAVEHGYPRTDAPEYLFVPTIGLAYGCKVLARRITKAKAMGPDVSDDIRLRAALASYNGGWWQNEPDDQPDRNAAYASKVLDRYEMLKGSRRA